MGNATGLKISSSALAVTDAVGLIEKLQGELDELRSGIESSVVPAGGAISVYQVRAVQARRRHRDVLFGADLFSDPAWDILLEAFRAELSQERVTITAICGASAVPATTALRWITNLERAGLLRRVPDRNDKRRTYLELSPAASERMQVYFNAAR